MRCATLSAPWRRLARAVIARVYEHKSEFRAEAGRRIHDVLMKCLPANEAGAIWNEGTAESRLSQKPHFDKDELEQLCDEADMLLGRYNADEKSLRRELEVMLTIASEAMKLSFEVLLPVSAATDDPMLELIADFQSVRSMHEAPPGRRTCVDVVRGRPASQDLVEGNPL
jgi:hypothetical protein